MGVSKVDKSNRKDDRYYVRVQIPHSQPRMQYKKVVRGHQAARDHFAAKTLEFSRTHSAMDRKTTVRELCVAILDAKQLTPNTRTRYRRLLDDFVFPALGARQVASLAQEYLAFSALFGSVQADVGTPDGRRSGVATRRQVEMLVREMLAVGVRQGLLVRNPLDGVQWPTAGTDRPTFRPSMLEIMAVRDHVAGQRGQRLGSNVMFLAMLDTLAGSGVRIGELMALSEDDVDLDAATITISRQIVFVRSHVGADGVVYPSGYVFTGLKKAKRQRAVPPRVIPVPKFVLAALATTKLRNGTQSVTLPWGALDGPPQTHRLWFCSPTSHARPYAPNTFSFRLNRIGAHLDLAGSLHAHCYRHAYTTTLEQAGVPMSAIDQVTGHVRAGSISYLVYSGPPSAETLALVPKAIDTAWQAAQDAQREVHASTGTA